MPIGHPTFSRRNLLLSSVAALAAANLGLSLDRAAAADLLGAAAPDLDTYQPEFFTVDEWRAIRAICDRLIPADAEGPGALETNVPVFLDLQLSGDYGADWYLAGPFPKNTNPLFGYQMPYLPAQIYRRGLALVMQSSFQRAGAAFADLDTTAQDAFLTDLHDGKIDFSALGEEYLTSAGFFSQVWGDVKNGYLADPIYGGNKGMAAWVMIGYPGARASFREWVSQHDVPYPLGPVSLSGERA